MNKHIGLITCYDEAGSERVIETPDLDGYLRKIGVNKRGKLKSELFSRLQGSANRSCWFMNFNYRDFTDADLTRVYYMPVCGVKEQPEGRPIKFVEWLVFPEDELSGDGFNNNIFSVDYVTRHESVYKSRNELKEIISSRKTSTGKGIDTRRTDILCRILCAIWEHQTNNSMGRIVILLEDAENDSLELLRQLYLLIPGHLRLQMGFMTNVSAADLTQIGSKKGLPIYIMTASASEWDTIAQYSYSIQIFTIDTTNLDAYEFSEKKLSQLKRLADDMDEKTSARLDYVEQKVLESHQSNVSSFQYYGEILEKIYSGEMFWWYKDRIDSVEELEGLYRDQEVLMRNEDYRREALERFATTIYPNSDLAFSIIEIVKNENYPGRDRLIAFLSEDLEMKKQISAFIELRRLNILDKENALQEQKNQYDLEIVDLKKEHEVNLSRKEEENRKKLEETKEELSQKFEIEEKKYRDNIQDINKRNRELEDQLSSDGQRIVTLRQELQDARKDLGKSERDNDKLREDINRLELEKQSLKDDIKKAADPEGNYLRLKKAEDRINRLDDLNRFFKYTTIAASAAAILFILISGILFNHGRNVAKARDDYKAQLEKSKEELENAKNTLDEYLLEQGNTTTNASVADDKDNSDISAISKIEEDKQSRESDPATDQNDNKPSETPIEAENDQSNEGKSSKTDEEVGKEKLFWETEDVIEILKRAHKTLKFEDSEGKSSLVFHVKFMNEELTASGEKKSAQIGTYVDHTSSDKGAEDEAWIERPYDGLEGDQGFYGIDQESANRYLLHIAFADDEKGSGFSSTELGERKYIGYYVDRETESNMSNSQEPDKYKWKVIIRR